MTRRLPVVALILTLALSVAGCGGVDEDAKSDLEAQKAQVVAWAKELSATAAATLDAQPEDAEGSYDGVDRRGLSYDYSSYHYEVTARFQVSRDDAISALSKELGDYSPRVGAGERSLGITHDGLEAVFQTYPKGPGIVDIEVSGPAIEFDQDDMMELGWPMGEPVDLG